jgi:hypothetical protein
MHVFGTTDSNAIEEMVLASTYVITDRDLLIYVVPTPNSSWQYRLYMEGDRSTDHSNVGCRTLADAATKAKDWVRQYSSFHTRPNHLVSSPRCVPPVEEASQAAFYRECRHHHTS